MLSTAEKSVLDSFKQYQVTPGKMLCFYGPQLEKHKRALQELTDRQFLVQEQFKGAYSLTRAGFEAMKDSHPSTNGCSSV